MQQEIENAYRAWKEIGISEMSRISKLIARDKEAEVDFSLLDLAGLNLRKYREGTVQMSDSSFFQFPEVAENMQKR